MGDCLGCEQQAQAIEREFQYAKSEARKYAEAKKTSVGIYMEGREWHFIEATKGRGIPFREIIHFQNPDA